MFNWRHHVKCILAYSGTSGSLFWSNKKNSGEQEKESIICVRVGYKNPSLRITFCHHLASLVIPNGDPQDGFFYPTLTLMIDPYDIDIHFTDGILELACLIQIKFLVSYMGFD